ncbi:MAG: DNA double-strand break repair nuclease NurA [Armatimonadota bacterium]
MLDLSLVTDQVAYAAKREAERRAHALKETALAVDVANAWSGEAWGEQVQRIRAARTSWLVAHSAADSAPAVTAAAPAVPPRYVVVAADGSQIAPDRHDGVTSCWLLHIGRVFLSYGTGKRPRLDSQAEVLILEEEGDEEPEQAAVRGLGARRFAREIAALGVLAAEASESGLPSVALTDGSLIAWTLYDEEGLDPAKEEGLKALQATLEATQRLQVPLVGYVSFPGSRDVVNALRITLCPQEIVNCERCPYPKDAKPCAPIRRASDAALFARLLGPGERSAVFTSSGQKTGFSHILPMAYGPSHWIAFFYLNVGAEIVRIEIPAWAAERPDMVDLVHAVCLDQARKGRGYPVALAEAHERAVVRGADRAAFLNLLNRHLVKAGEPATQTRKALAKQSRAL